MGMGMVPDKWVWGQVWDFGKWRLTGFGLGGGGLLVGEGDESKGVWSWHRGFGNDFEDGDLRLTGLEGWDSGNGLIGDGEMGMAQFGVGSERLSCGMMNGSGGR